jgi:pimeloyl-ACP methyl ester carboxylesterase
MSEDAQTAAPPRLAIKHQTGTEGGPPVLLLHGAWHASWVWENWLSLFAARGWDAYVLDLRGHGASEGSYREARLTDYLADVRGAIDTFERTPVLVGHSLGGLLIQHLVAEQTFPAAVLLAPIPGRYPVGAMVRFGRRHPLVMFKANLRRDLIHLVGTPALTRETLFTPDTPEETVQACHERLIGASPALFRDMTLTAPPSPLGDTPTLVVAPGEDRFFTPQMQRRLAKRMGADFREISGCGHDVPLDRPWRQAAQTLVQWLSDVIASSGPRRRK